MPKLRDIALSYLLEQDTYSHPDFSDGLSDSEEKVVIEVSATGICRVDRTLKSPCEKMATRRFDFQRFEGRVGELYPHCVDLRRGYAASLVSE
jgi:hypothetical protein